MAVAIAEAGVLTEWTADPAAEAMFNNLGVVWEYVPGVNIALIDREMSLKNQARLGVSLLTDVVEEYALAMLDGAVFPALVAFPLPNGTYMLAGGNHRLAAAQEARRKTADLYVLRVNDEAMRRLITTTLNTLVGVRPERTETIEQAIAWMQRYGRSVKNTAAFFGIPERALSKEIRMRATRARIQAAGFSPSSFAKSHVERFGAIQNTNVLRMALALQERASLPEPAVNQMVVEIREQSTEAAQLSVVQQWMNRDDVKIRMAEKHPVRQSPTDAARSQLFRMLTGASKILDRLQSRGQAGLSNDDDYAAAVSSARSIAERLEALGAA